MSRLVLLNAVRVYRRGDELHFIRMDTSERFIFKAEPWADRLVALLSDGVTPRELSTALPVSTASIHAALEAMSEKWLISVWEERLPEDHRFSRQANYLTASASAVRKQCAVWRPHMSWCWASVG